MKVIELPLVKEMIINLGTVRQPGEQVRPVVRTNRLIKRIQSFGMKTWSQPTWPTQPLN